MKKAFIKLVTKGKNKGQFRFVLKRNGETIAQSHPETYTQKHNCISTLKNSFPDFKIIDTVHPLPKGKTQL